MTGMRYLVYEEGVGGHFLVFVKYLVEAIRNRGGHVRLMVGRGNERSREYAKHLAPVAGSIEVLLSDSTPSLSDICKTAKSMNIDQVIVPNGAVFAYAPKSLLTTLHGCRVTLLIMADPFCEPASVAVAIKRLILRTLSLRPGLRILRLASARTLPGTKGIAPDPVSIGPIEETTALVEVKRWRGSRKMFLLAGVVVPWKNPILVAETFLESNVEDACLVIAGPISPALRPRLLQLAENNPSRMRVVDALLSEGEFNAFVADAFAVVMAYSTHAPNSTSAKAAAMGVRMVVAGSRSFRRQVELLGGAQVSVPLERASLVGAFHDAVVLARPQPVVLAGVDDFASAMLGDGHV